MHSILTHLFANYFQGTAYSFHANLSKNLYSSETAYFCSGFLGSMLLPSGGNVREYNSSDVMKILIASKYR
jgi:hypothetical protein